LFAVSAFFHVVLLSLLPSRTSFFNCPVYGGQVREIEYGTQEIRNCEGRIQKIPVNMILP
ncbi:MAG: hypothetical protein ORN23_04455, partial [Chthoniobacterales bacterium]|nr:hypothetical protein [Chthoniobacterales bacterium]